MPEALPTPCFIYSTSQIREIEHKTGPGSSPPLMERAGLAAAQIALTLAPQDGTPILVLAGPGNNGGDALVVARLLKEKWHAVDVVFPADPGKLPPDAQAAFAAWVEAGGMCYNNLPAGRHWGLVIDGLFGIGLQRPLGEPYAALVEQVNALQLPTLALDIPSGLAADSGLALGPTIRATQTVTFIGLKPGLMTGDGPDYCGEILLRDLQLDHKHFPSAAGRLLQQSDVAHLLAPRPLNSHKALFGSVGILGGAPGMSGAALLAGRAALKLGAGRVYVGMLETLACDPQQPELMLRNADAVLELTHLSCLVIGPGLGQSAQALKILTRAMESTLPLVLDADALNLLAQDASLQQRLAQRTSPTLLTPHAAEAARLLACDTTQINQQRLDSAKTLAAKLHSHVALKGAGTICVDVDGSWAINDSGNPGLASAGTGDVLSGMLGALLSQGLPMSEAMRLGVYLHGAAADALLIQGIGPVGMTASEVIDSARAMLNHWIYG